jgi:hypothetical protein
MHERQAHHQKQDDPIEAETDSDAKEREATADIHRISRPCEYAFGRERQGWLRWSNVRADPLKDAIGANHHSDTDNQRDGADHDPAQDRNMVEQAKRHKKIEDNPHYQSRERDQRGKDQDIWRIAGGVGHGVIRLALGRALRPSRGTRLSFVGNLRLISLLGRPNCSILSRFFRNLTPVDRLSRVPRLGRSLARRLSPSWVARSEV